MNNQKFITHIRDHIADNQLDTALQLLRDLLDNSPQLDEVIQQAGRYASIRQQIRLGTVSHADATLTENQIRQGLIDLLGEIETQGKDSRLLKEIGQAVSIVNSKNVNAGNVQANTVHFGDKTDNSIDIEGDNNLTLKDITVGRDINIGSRIIIIIKNSWIGLTLGLAFLLICALALGIMLQQDTPQKQTGENPIFKENDENFKILILPFKSLCEYKGKQYDAGYVIKERLQAIIADESLKITSFYLKDYNIDNLDDIKTKELQEYHYADMIVYGTYQTDDCSNEGDKICLNYRTDSKWKLNKLGANLSRIPKLGGLNELQRGKIQEKVEDIASFLSVIAQQKNINHERYVENLQKFLERKDIGSSKAYIYVDIALLLGTDGNINETIPLYETALKIFKHQNNLAGMTICQQNLGIIYKELGQYEKALDLYNTSYETSYKLHKSDTINSDYIERIASSLNAIGTLELYDFGNILKALKNYHEARRLLEKIQKEEQNSVSFLDNLAIIYENIGYASKLRGNLEEATTYYGKNIVLMEQICDKYSGDTYFMHGLGISYSKLGEVYLAKGDKIKSFEYFKKANYIQFTLLQENPYNVEVKKSLAISYTSLGRVSISTGDLISALGFYSQSLKISEELHSMHPNTPAFISRLAVCHEKMGTTFFSIRNLEKASIHFEKFNNLMEDLCVKFPQNLKYKSGLAISYDRLADINARLGKTMDALNFYIKYNEIKEMIYQFNSENVESKNGFAISYMKLGEFYLNKMHDKPKAKEYHQKAHDLWYELVADHPTYIEFQERLKGAKRNIENL